jgi:hypothetical protein
LALCCVAVTGMFADIISDIANTPGAAELMT